MSDLQVITTWYSRGPVVKLSRSHSVESIRKFVIENKRGHVTVKSQGHDSRGKPAVETRLFSGTVDQAVVEAQRECERIRCSYEDGGTGAR